MSATNFKVNFLDVTVINVSESAITCIRAIVPSKIQSNTTLWPELYHNDQ